VLSFQQTCSSASSGACRAATKMLPKIEGLLYCELATVWRSTWCTKLLVSVVRGSAVNTSPAAAAAHAASTNKLPVHRGARAAASFTMAALQRERSRQRSRCQRLKVPRGKRLHRSFCFRCRQSYAACTSRI
jgi:hypothetical protein